MSDTATLHYVLAFGTYDVTRHPRAGTLVEGLRAHGVRVEECNEPLRLSTADRVRMLREPWRLPFLAVELARCWLVLARRARRLPPPPVVLVGYLGHFDVLLARVLFRRAVVVHDMLVFAGDTAHDRRAGSFRQWLLRRLDAAAIAASDVLVVDTDEHRSALPPQRQADGVVVLVGAPTAWNAPAPEERGGPLRAVFFGLFTPLQGAPVIGAAIGLRPPAVEFTMVGTGQDLDSARTAAGDGAAEWVPWLESAELAGVVARHDVCLGIFSAAGKGTRVVPNKVYQGAAAGCAVVTSDTAPQRRVLRDAAVFVQPEDPVALAAALGELAADRSRLLEMRHAAWELAREEFTPEAVVRPLIDHLQRGGAA